MKILLYKFGKYLMFKFCQHEHKELIWIDYPERYMKYYCKVCKKETFEDI